MKSFIIIINPTLLSLATLSVNSLKGPQVKSEVIKFPLAVTTPLVSGMSFFMQQGGDPSGWGAWPLVSGG